MLGSGVRVTTRYARDTPTETARSMNAVPVRLKGRTIRGKANRVMSDWDWLMLCTPKLTELAKKLHGTIADRAKRGYGMVPVSTFTTFPNTSVAGSERCQGPKTAHVRPMSDCR